MWRAISSMISRHVNFSIAVLFSSRARPTAFFKESCATVVARRRLKKATGIRFLPVINLANVKLSWVFSDCVPFPGPCENSNAPFELQKSLRFPNVFPRSQHLRPRSNRGRDFKISPLYYIQILYTTNRKWIFKWNFVWSYVIWWTVVIRTILILSYVFATPRSGLSYIQFDTFQHVLQTSRAFLSEAASVQSNWCSVYRTYFKHITIKCQTLSTCTVSFTSS